MLEHSMLLPTDRSQIASGTLSLMRAAHAHIAQLKRHRLQQAELRAMSVEDELSRLADAAEVSTHTRLGV
jgi:hypothetical protein